MIVRNILNKKEKAISSVLSVYRSVEEYGSTCPCHGVKNCKKNLKVNSNNKNKTFNNINKSNSNVNNSHHHSKPLIFDMKLQEKQQQLQYHNQNQRHYYSIGGGHRTKDRNNYYKRQNNPNADYAFEMATSSIRFGIGVTREVGLDLLDMNVKNVIVFTDKNLVALGNESPVWTVCESLKMNGINFVLYDDVSIEPTDISFKKAIQFVLDQERPVDAFVAVGGGSTMDTAKAANLYSTYPTTNFLDYVNAPIGNAKPVPGPLKPFIAIPTTAGTGSETTGVSVFDLVSMKAKTGIASRRLKPTLGLVDPQNTITMPRNVAIASGFDQLCHALESYTAIPFNERTPRPQSPVVRPAYQGANPISDIWALQSLQMINDYLPIAVNDPDNDEARSNVMLASSLAGVGFGNAGVHLCHGMSYPISGMVREYRPEGYNTEHPIIPHGFSVILNAPAVFKFTAAANPERHLKCAKILGVDTTNVRDEDAGLVLSDAIKKIMHKMGVPDGLSAIGFTRDDIPELVKGTIPQHRVTKLSPNPVGTEELTKLFEETMTIY